jgi:hypothetical protein
LFIPAVFDASTRLTRLSKNSRALMPGAYPPTLRAER